MPDNVSDLLLRLQNEILETVAYGESLGRVADLLCRRAESLAPGTICSILTVDNSGLLHPLASPSLPVHYSNALNGVPIGPSVGSCGTAAFRREAIVVVDIENDPLWADFKVLALPIGLKACWSSPIMARDGRVVGTFAFYHRDKLGPNEIERLIVETCVHLCAIAIEYEEVQERNHRLAYFDVLTGLPNRGRFNTLLESRIAAQEPFGLLLVDIDHLKSINDTMGHVFGDVFIRQLGQRLGSVNSHMTACRIGGDEFAVLVGQCRSNRDLHAAATKVLRKVDGLIESGVYTISPSVTIGGAVFDADGADAETLCQNADFALYHAKETNRGGYVRFEAGLRTSIIDRANLVRSVDTALVEGRVFPHYQPIVRLDSGEIVGLEALARVRSSDGIIVSAAEFHKALSDPRIAYELTTLMLSEVATDIRTWLDAGIPIQHVGINVTTGDFQRGDLEDRLVSAFNQAGVPLKHVLLEVNEAMYMGGAEGTVAKRVEALRRKGVRVALDDFGTGFASLTHLLTFPVDIIKIDKSFIDKLVTDAPSRVIVAGTIDIARKLGMKIVAEGVETAEQADCLSDLGCTLGQGYHFSRPCSAQDVTMLLRAFAQGLKSDNASQPWPNAALG